MGILLPITQEVPEKGRKEPLRFAIGGGWPLWFIQSPSFEDSLVIKSTFINIRYSQVGASHVAGHRMLMEVDGHGCTTYSMSYPSLPGPWLLFPPLSVPSSEQHTQPTAGQRELLAKVTGGVDGRVYSGQLRGWQCLESRTKGRSSRGRVAGP